MTSEGMGARKGIRGYWERMGYAKENMAYLVCGGPSHRTTSECFFFFFYQFYIFKDTDSLIKR